MPALSAACCIWSTVRLKAVPKSLLLTFMPGGMPGMPGGMSGSGGPMGQRDLGDKKRLFKLVDGRPHPVLVKPGLTDGSSTEMVEGDLKPGDELITDILGVPTGPTRKLGAF